MEHSSHSEHRQDGMGHAGHEGHRELDNPLLDNDRFAAAERERFLALKRVVAQIERGLDSGASAWIAKLEAR
jgi:hypothetical protein